MDTKISLATRLSCSKLHFVVESTEHKKSHFLIDKMMWNGNRSDDVVVIHITSVLRTKEMKLNLYSELVKVLTVNPGVRKEDIFVTIVDNTPENWSFGKGLAQLST
ncbi:tautomerase family protein [Polynucleobacter sp. IMCC 29146]|uniref:tautomerase family protein n=1 Tax=Polynucleobacter sp. IMCC 29146 TaxID=2780953 RepID=UPI00210517BC|nr:tautomerase family protein [Polynucleobacter sp. IMCC 29146]